MERLATLAGFILAIAFLIWVGVKIPVLGIIWLAMLAVALISSVLVPSPKGQDKDPFSR